MTEVPEAIAVALPAIDTTRPRPVLATRNRTALHPRSGDQAGYWTEVVQSFRDVMHSGDAVVPMLLVASTNSRALLDLLTTALAEIGMAEICPAHRSRRDHLLRATQRGFAVVDVIDHWPDWVSLSDEAGVALQPVVEAVPLEEWFARTKMVELFGSDAASDDAEGPVQTPATGSMAVPGATLLDAIPQLVAHALLPWLDRTGLGASDRAPLIIDTRLDTVSPQLRASVAMRPLTGGPLSPPQQAQLDLVFAPLRIEREDAPSDYAAMERFLVAHWQPSGKSDGNAVDSFKPSQKLAMEAIRTRAQDVMVALPTGEGKSVLFQVPALCRGLRNRRLTLVLSPLKALMRDQVARLREQGFGESAEYLSSDMTSSEIAAVLQGVLDHRIVLLYVAPERLRNAAFTDVLDRRILSDGGLEYVVFDETHCVNQWGYEFRPDYFHAFNSLLQRLRTGRQSDVTPVLMMSATITASDRRFLAEILTLGSHDAAVLPLKICPDSAVFTNPLRDHITVNPVQVRGNILDKQSFDQALLERLPHIIDAIDKAQANRKATGQRSAVIVFVSRRAHAEKVASRLATRVDCDVECYRAGLDSATRDDIYSRFRDGDLDVLVATKAFGMGMDIPDIHWVIHLSPPTYLEDYLQEVGRIGRGVQERKRAKLGQLSAVMLFSPADFETTRSLRARNELRAPQIKDIEAEIVKNTQQIDGRKVAIVPQHGYEEYDSAAEMRANATRLRMALHWLEKAGHLDQLGMVADLLTIDLHSTKLSEIGAEQSAVGAVARAVLSLTAAPDDKAANPAPSTGLLGGLLNWLQRMIGVNLDPPAAIIPTSRASAEHSTVVINLSQVRLHCQIATMGDTMACLVDLQKRGGLTLHWRLHFAERPMLSEPPERVEALMSSVSAAVRHLLRRLNTKGTAEFNPFEWLDEADWGHPVVNLPDGPITKDDKDIVQLYARYRRAYLSGFQTLARASGVRLRQTVRAEGEALVWHAHLPLANNQRAQSRCSERMTMARSLLAIFQDAARSNVTSVNVADLIRTVRTAHPQKRFNTPDLEATQGLLAALHIVSTQPDLLPMSYVLNVHDAPIGLDAHPDLLAELKGVSDLAEARSFAMEVFANLPAQSRETFVGGYFANAGAAELKGFLETELGDIDDSDGNLSSFIQSKRDQLRATKATEFFALYAVSEEPAQWAAIRHPFDHHLMVNAGPGAGKTSVLVGRIAHLIREQHIKPSEIVVLAFNRAVVFEIKKRVRELFRSLGYAAYAEQVRVSTFHTLAMRSLHQADDQSAPKGREDILPVFAARMAQDDRFRTQVAGGCRAILIDEFQDVTEDVYAVIRNLYLGSSSRAGVMVIGDDDQDILRWQRRNNSRAGSEFSEVFFDRFEADFAGPTFRHLELAVNFRSGAEIVTRSQKMISGFFGKSTQSRRLKVTDLRTRTDAARDHCARTDWRGKTWDETLDMVARSCDSLLAQNPGSLAVLCRSNSEVAQVHHRLAKTLPGIAIQSGANMQIAYLRHVGHWIDFLESEPVEQDRLMTEPLKEELLGKFRQAFAVPETQSRPMPEVDLATLWTLCCAERNFPHLSHLVRFLRALKMDDLQRLLGSLHAGTQSVVSTIHKVKGLEFDNVVIVPSMTPFGKADHGRLDALEKDAAEEARLLYVAMTRAKTRLDYFVGDREYAWAATPPRVMAGTHGQSLMLVGGLDEVDLGWAWRKGPYNQAPDDRQTYIEGNVCVGDRIVLGGHGVGAGKGLVHIGTSGASQQIGFLSRQSGAAGPQAELTVHAVVRYPADDRDAAAVGDLVAQRGWGYAVMVAGRLR